MKILSIRIKNLASLEGVTEIDFSREPLLSAGIFAITGPTGAGKSTILDALCLALYGKTPRYLQAKEAGIEITDVQGSAKSQGDVRGILRDGTGEGFAEVDFVGIDRQLYKATWRVRRARDRADGSLQAYNVALKNINTGTDIPGKKTELLEEIERLVGLNFEQFTRSVLLAQGDFTAFLKAAKDEKSALLEKLTGTHIYSEISIRVFESYRKEERELENMNIQRAGISTLTVEELAALVEQKSEIEKIIEAQGKDVEALNREIAWHVQLSLLQSNLAKAYTAHEQANETRQNANVRERELKIAEQVQPARTLVDGLQTAKSQLEGKTNTLQELQKGLHDLLLQKEASDLQLQKAKDDLDAKAQKQEEAIPFLEEAKELDIQIKEKTEQVNKAATEVKETDQHYKQQEQQLQDKQQQADQLLTNIGKLQQWKVENNGRQPIAENHSIISSKLSDARKMLDSLQLLLPNLETTQTNINQTIKKRAELETLSSSIKQKLELERERQTIVTKSLSAIPITTIEGEKVTVDINVEDLITAEAHWKILFNNEADLDSLKKKLSNNKREFDTKEQLLTKTIEQFVVFKTERDTSLFMFDKARLAATENVETLRLQLIPGDPCPVCGNTEHPYATEHPQLDRVLQELEKGYHQHENAYSTCLALEISLRETGNQLKEIMAVQEQELSTKEIVLKGLQQTWQSFTICDEAVSISDEQKATWLAQQLHDKRIKQKALQEQIKLYAAKKQELEIFQNNLNDFERQLNENNNAVKDAERSLQSLQEQGSQYYKEQLKGNNTLSEIEQSLSGYFVVKDWFSHWKKEPESFLHRISDFTENWKNNTNKIDEDTQQHSVLSATLKAMQEQLQGLLADAQKKQKALEDLSHQQYNLTQKRMGIFNGEAAATVQLGLKQAVEAAQQVVEETKADSEKLKTEITRISTQKEQVEKDIASFQKQEKTQTEKIQLWLSTFNTRHQLELDTDRLLELLALSPEWIEAERLALRSLDDALTQAKSVLEERTIQLQHHEKAKISERTEAVLNELLNDSKATLQQQVKEKNETDFRLKEDKANKKKIGDLLGIIETKVLIVENWAKLNEIIGSADGKKFRQIAQEYTLDVLLSFANVHLEMLSKRYLLQRIPNTLALQVLDQDMGDEIRTVFSLSGGESFLVSLALALGLASLSSSRMQVESLFIDEGFGSLDPTTLNIAMDALERLHNQGRKVGVISHVQEMTERIPVQIRVSKQSSGRSLVKVTGSNN